MNGHDSMQRILSPKQYLPKSVKLLSYKRKLSQKNSSKNGQTSNSMCTTYIVLYA
jgi:hypothetical protein